MKIAGVDEAGRGPVIGPMVVAGILIDEGKEDELISMGVKDSKLVSPINRKRLYGYLTEKYEHFIIVIDPYEVDEAVLSDNSNLNYLETTKMAMILNKLMPDKAIIDAPSVNIEKFSQELKNLLKGDFEIKAEHKADLIYPVVGAASILAKERREQLIEELKKKHNVDFGSGYPADPKTKAFLEKNYDKYDFFRKSWATYKKIIDGKQTSLGDF